MLTHTRTLRHSEYLNPSTSKGDWHLVFPYKIHIKVMETKEINTMQKKKLLIVKQILPVSTLENV